METMSPLDASFLHIEDAVTHMHIGSVGIFEGPPPGPGEVRDAIAERLPLVPRYRQKVRFVPFALGRPVWVDDPHFNLDYHVRRTALPAPGGDDELRNLVGRVMSQQLDRSKPLWELWVAEGLDSGRWAMVSKTHHCMVDGVSGTDLLSVILSSDRESEVEALRCVAPRARAELGELGHALAVVAGGKSVRGDADRNGGGPGSSARREEGRRHRSRPCELPNAARPGRDELAERADRAAPTLGLGSRAPV